MPSRFQLPPIVKAAERLLVDIEQAVRRFDRYHRYQIGADLRKHAAEVYRLANRAGRDVNQRHQLVPQLVWAVDEVKQTMQIAKLIHAFKSFRQFEALARQAEDVGKQAGGWRKLVQHPKVQNAPAQQGVTQRGQKLSARAASTGANP